MLNIEEIACVRNLPRRKKAQEEENASKNRKEGEHLKIIVVER